MGNFLRLHKFPLLLVITGLLFYSSFGYSLEREDFVKLITLYTGLFFVSWKLIQLEKVNFWFLASIALLFRLIFIGAQPVLSQDFYRFIWDGKMLLAGWNPYLYLPQELIEQGTAPISKAAELYYGMGKLSAGNYTNYPPLNQLIFALAAFAGKGLLGPVIVMRLVIIAADVGVLYFGKKLLEKLGLPRHRIFWYILNPLVIIELTGNLHFEGVMVFFLVWSLYLLHHKKWILSAILFAASVLLKIISLLFLPLLIGYFIKEKKGVQSPDFKKLFGYYLIVGLTVILGFLPFLSPTFFSSFGASLALWFQKFEFNASFYYLVRWVGFQVKGYNIIETAGKVLPLIVLAILLGLTFFRKNNSTERLISGMLLGISVYFFLATTVHPWYLVTPLLLSIFTRYRFVLIWSFFVMLSYFTYSNPEFQENLWLVAMEYVVVLLWFVREIYVNTNNKKMVVAGK
ncbi:mannosyltransferase [Antarcticibacterium arcticum]|uniref:Mannosyltransferase n=1 Tax=Antarcticibacterium arcticum TaxID=2585771 RepID=A0A5B8YQK4_9FLAO|nr:mannosyltransferase [Antarcticibacterium arcticum]QED38239.1 mannosyltransferase [Antarcticibacterium arcticum]